MSASGREIALLAAAISSASSTRYTPTTSELIARANRLYRYLNSGIPYDAYTELEVDNALIDED